MVDISFTMVVQWVNFLILLLLLYRFLFKPMVDFLDKRSAHIGENINEAREKNEQAQKTLEEYEEKMRGIKAEALDLMASVQKDADKEKNKILDEASREARYLVDKSKVEIEQEIVKAHKELKKQLSKLVVSCTERVIEREVTEEDHKKLIDEFIRGTEEQ